MYRPSVDEMLENKKTRYSLVIAVAKRAREISMEQQVVEGSEEKKEDRKIEEKKPVLVALDEFKAHKYSILEPEVDD